MQKWLIRKLGGYASIEEALEAAPKETLDMAVSKLYCIISKDDILRKDGVNYYYKNRQLSQDELKNLVSEAKLIRRLELWRIITKELYYQGSKKMYFESQNVNDVTWAKLLFFVADILETKLKSLEKLDGKV